ncbi:MAG: hypothetical protein ISR72_12570 [Methylobacter sp.]|nr:hypothetical protein [Methylobacter sp.]
MVAYAKQTPDGAILYFEEVRKKRRDLAVHAMRRYPATSDAVDILHNVPLYVRNDGGHGQSIDESDEQVYNQTREKRTDYKLDLFDFLSCLCGSEQGKCTCLTVIFISKLPVRQ